MLVEQLKAYAFCVDLFQALEQDPSTKSDIGMLLKKFSGQKLPESTVPFLIDFEPLFDRICHYVVEKQKFVDLIQQKADNSTKEWDLSEALEQKVDALEVKA